jgi:hypothetical protein
MFSRLVKFHGQYRKIKASLSQEAFFRRQVPRRAVPGCLYARDGKERPSLILD